MRALIILLSFLLYLGTTVCSAAYYTLKMINPAENYSLKYDDENIYASFAMAKKNPDRLFISIYNKTDEVIVVKWPETSLIFSGKAHTVLPATQIATGLNAYSGVKEVSIPPHTTLEESLFAEGSINYIREPVVVRGGLGGYRGWGGWGGWIGFDDFLVSQGNRGSWKTKPFFPNAKNDEDAAAVRGSSFGLFLPLTVSGKEITQRFEFLIDNVSPKQSPGSLGMMVADRTELDIIKKESSMQSGVLVMALAKKSAAKDAGILTDDNIIQIDGLTIENIEDFVKILNQKKAGENISLTLLRQDKQQTVTVKLKKL